MVKETVSITIERKLRKRIDEELEREGCLFSNRSRFIEYHLMGLFYPRRKTDISVSKKES